MTRNKKLTLIVFAVVMALVILSDLYAFWSNRHGEPPSEWWQDWLAWNMPAFAFALQVGNGSALYSLRFFLGQFVQWSIVSAALSVLVISLTPPLPKEKQPQ
jgi:hypothetical protein